jgi:hypothetical protein
LSGCVQLNLRFFNSASAKIMAVSGRKNFEIASEKLVEVLASAPVSVKSEEKKNENNELNKEKGQFQVVLPDQIH